MFPLCLLILNSFHASLGVRKFFHSGMQVSDSSSDHSLLRKFAHNKRNNLAADDFKCSDKMGGEIRERKSNLHEPVDAPIWIGEVQDSLD